MSSYLIWHNLTPTPAGLETVNAGLRSLWIPFSCNLSYSDNTDIQNGV